MPEAPVRAGPTLLTAANTSQTIYTAPSSGWAIIRDIVVVNEGTATVAFTIGIGTTNADAAGKRIALGVSLAPNADPWTWGGFLVLAGGATPDLLYALCDTANGVTVTASLVTGP